MLCDEGFKKELRKGDIWISYMVLSLAWLQVYNCPVISFKRFKKKWKHIFFWISHMASLSVQSQSRDRTYDLFPHGKLYSTQSYNKYFSLLFCSMAMQSDKNGWIYSTLLLKERPNKGHRILKYQTENCHVDWTFNQELGLQEIMSLTLFCFAEN